MPAIDATSYPKAQRHPQRHGYQLRGTTPTAIVLHTTNNARRRTTFEAEATFLLNSPDVSAHYLIGKDGRIVELLAPGPYQAWHAGTAVDAFRNARSIGIELHVSVGETPTPAQIDAAGALVRQLAAQFGIPAALVETHRTIARPPGRKSDPEGWPDAAFYAWRAGLFDPPPPTDPPIVGPATCDIDQAAKLLLSVERETYTGQEISTIILPAYFDVCARGGVDPCVAIAQLIHETDYLRSWWSQRDRRNPAGIGVTGRTSATEPATGAWQQDGAIWREGCAFGGWVKASIPAHVGRLLAYAVRDADATPAQAALIAQALAVRGLPASYRGCAPTVGGLGGRWAVPGWGYGTKIAGIMERMRGL